MRRIAALFVGLSVVSSAVADPIIVDTINSTFPGGSGNGVSAWTYVGGLPLPASSVSFAGATAADFTDNGETTTGGTLSRDVSGGPASVFPPAGDLLLETTAPGGGGDMSGNWTSFGVGNKTALQIIFDFYMELGGGNSAPASMGVIFRGAVSGRIWYAPIDGADFVNGWKTYSVPIDHAAWNLINAGGSGSLAEFQSDLLAVNNAGVAVYYQPAGNHHYALSQFGLYDDPVPGQATGSIVVLY